jgi:hypothetical protein
MSARKLFGWLGRGAFNVLVAIDQLGNAIAGGDPDETISSRAGKLNRQRLWATMLCNFLNWLDPGHCTDAIEPDEGEKALK